MIIGAPALTALPLRTTLPRALPPASTDAYQRPDSRSEARAVLEGAGRRDPAADLQWLEKRFGRATDLGDLAKFYVIAQGRYAPSNPERSKLIASSLESLRSFLDEGSITTTWQGGQIISKEETLKMTRDERVDCLQTMLRNLPPEKSSYVLPVSDSIRILGILRKEVIDRQPDDRTATYHVGGSVNNNRYLTFEPPAAPRPSMTRLVSDYTRCLDLITHAEGRASAKLEWGDDISAAHAVELLHCGVPRDAEHAARFEHLMSVLQSPWHAHAVLTDLDWVPPAQRDAVQDHLLDTVREYRSRAGAPQNELETIKEGTRLNGLSRVICWGAALAAPGQTRDAAEADAAGTLRFIETKITGNSQDKAFALCLMGRAPSESTTAVAADVAKLQWGLHAHGHSREGAFHIFETLARTPDFAANRAAVIEAFLQQRAQLPKGTDPLLVEEGLQHASPDALGAELKALSDRLYLTGHIDGMERLRGRVDADLKAGVLAGDVDEMMRVLEMQVRLNRVSGASPEDAVEKAYRSLKSSRCRQLSVSIEQDRVVIGGIVLPRRA